MRRRIVEGIQSYGSEDGADDSVDEIGASKADWMTKVLMDIQIKQEVDKQLLIEMIAGLTAKFDQKVTSGKENTANEDVLADVDTLTSSTALSLIDSKLTSYSKDSDVSDTSFKQSARFYVDGHEEPVEVINAARGAYIELNKVDELPYVKVPMPDVEKAFVAYYNMLSSKVRRSPAEEMELNRYDLSKFPKCSGDDLSNFFFWLDQMVHYKNRCFIPDQTIRPLVVAAAAKTKHEGLKQLVEATTRVPAGDEWYPIRYGTLFQMGKNKLRKSTFADIVGTVLKSLEVSCEPQSFFLTIHAEVTNYIAFNPVESITSYTWIKLLKVLFDKAPAYMEKTIVYMKSLLTISRSTGKAKTALITIDGEEMRNTLLAVKDLPQAKLVATNFDVSFIEV